MSDTPLKSATFAAGCFWDVEAAFRSASGVTNTAVGYCGGHLAEPSYRDVCTGRTGHAEVVRVEFDPRVVSYDELLDVFWSCHDPTLRSRLGSNDQSQYRSTVFFHDVEQEQAAKASLARLEAESRYAKPVLTQIRSAGVFYLAEDYHQQYLERRGVER